MIDCKIVKKDGQSRYISNVLRYDIAKEGFAYFVTTDGSTRIAKETIEELYVKESELRASSLEDLVKAHYVMNISKKNIFIAHRRAGKTACADYLFQRYSHQEGIKKIGFKKGNALRIYTTHETGFTSEGVERDVWDQVNYYELDVMIVDDLPTLSNGKCDRDLVAIWERNTRDLWLFYTPTDALYYGFLGEINIWSVKRYKNNNRIFQLKKDTDQKIWETEFELK